MNSLIITEFLGASAKAYSHLHLDKNMEVVNKKALKGVSKVVVKNEITHADYVKVLETGIPLVRDVVGIRSYNHQLFTVQQKKTALTSYYDKMKLIDNINCVPFGYNPKIKKCS